MRTVNRTVNTTSARVAPLRRPTVGAVPLTAGRQHPLIALHRAAGNRSVHRLLQRAPSTVSKDYSRGNDDQWECCYETASITVSLTVDDSVCGKDKSKDKNKKVPASISYAATLGGKTKEADGSAPTQGTNEGPDHYLEEQGVKNPKQVKLVAGNTKGPDPGNSLGGVLPLENLTTCGGSAKSGCVLVKGPKSNQQEIKWSAAGTTAKDIKANQLVQPPDPGMNRLKAAVPLRGKDGHPKFKDAQPRHKNCWCDPETGYHLNYSGKDKCPSTYRVADDADIPEGLESLKKTKAKPKELPKVCTVDKSPGKIC